ncbi:MAG: methyl-accepting chemotaxis protein [Bacillus sp. (in: Bacteria)]|nr:methyl-accepting chemotaxis protein [Bacillus sp. (in: firmicutes)]MCM1427721.1 methyl-accepting chemotaxis protein [Eubacterium sp.]
MKKINLKQKIERKEKPQKAEKTSKAEKLSKAGKSEKAGKSSGFMLLGIRNKIVICFLVPIIFMIIVGVSAYQKAAEGMSEKFQESTLQTIDMTKENLELLCSFIKAEGVKYAFDGDVGKYLAGTMESPVDEKNIKSAISSDMISFRSAISFIGNIYVIPGQEQTIITTATNKKVPGVYNEHRETVATGKSSIEMWIDSHPIIDEAVEETDDEYIISYEILSKSKNGCIVIDVKRDEIEKLIGGLDLGNGSIIGFVTENGREVIAQQLAEGEESILTDGEQVFFGQEFYNGIHEENMSGSMEIKFHGEKYLFFYSRSEDVEDITLCALVPMNVVTSQAQEIRALTIALVILACIIALVIGVFVVAGIQGNMRSISKKFGEVAKGDLTVTVQAKGRDEFQGLAASATNMITNTKNLVNKVSNATNELEKSAVSVEEVSTVINECSQNITQVIDEIHGGIARQSENAVDCVERTDILSNEIQEVGRVVEKVEALVEENGTMINHGIEIIRLLGERAQKTTEMTSEVGSSIESLKKEYEIINSFVETITSISEQTNLLSLNASIEAARAGEAGRGFSVVAEEIRKLADDSAAAAGEIQNNVSSIMAQTESSVKNADQAQEMVALQSESVEQVIKVFGDMRTQMNALAEGLQEIVTSMEKADAERSDTVQGVQNISNIIEETANSAEKVKDIAGRLLEHVENLNQTADLLGENMQGLKSEISVFKI